MSYQHKQPDRGFTLIETITVIVILALAIPPLLWSVSEAHQQRANPTLASRARWLAVEKLEDIIADRNSSTRGYDYLQTSNYPAEPSVTGFAAFSRSVAFNETEADLTTAGDGYMNVTVSVTWTDTTGQSRYLAISTVLTDFE